LEQAVRRYTLVLLIATVGLPAMALLGQPPPPGAGMPGRANTDHVLLPPLAPPAPMYYQHVSRLPSGAILWQIVAGWAQESKSGGAVLVRNSNDLVGVALQFGTGVPKTETDPFIASAAEPDPEGLRIRIDPRLAADDKTEPNLARQALDFFWHPGAAEEPRFQLALPEGPMDYRTVSHKEPIPGTQLKDPGMVAVRSLLDEIGSTNTGRVFWLVEPDDPDPRHVIVAWLPRGVPWLGVKVASPAWPEIVKPVVFEPPGQWGLAKAQEVHGVRRAVRTGLAPLPAGTWKLLRQGALGGKKLIAFGREGLVLQAAGGYEVHLLRIFPEGIRYDAPLRTKGIGPGGDPPPA
jgi:hypothetical protein